MSHKRATPAQPPTLTAQEQQLLQSIWDGQSIAQTAEVFSIGLRAAESARNMLKYRFGSRNTAQLLRAALRYGMLKL